MNTRKHLFEKTLFVLAIIFLGATVSYSQSDTTTGEHYAGLSLKDLLNVKIVTVSKNQELLFDAALSASVVTKDEIKRTGCTSIMEALRLVPGVIVREQSNGNYDIHLRGMDNTPPNASFDIASTTTLVMINNRPIYSYLRGGTFWETLPVDINDVERIEVVRGPAGALYGPNAVNGVINIITRAPKIQGLYLLANSQQGTNHTFINNASIGYKADKWSAVVSGNHQDRLRSQTSYFEFFRNQAFTDPDYFITFNGDTARNVTKRYPHAELAMEKYAGNIFLEYNPSRNIKLNLDAGAQHSVVQKVSAENEITPLSTASSDTKYMDFRAFINKFSAQFSYNGGIQNVDYDPGNKFHFRTFDGSVEYNYSKKNFSLKPGISYRSAAYDDTKYSDTVNKVGIFNTRGEINTLSASLRAEYTVMKNRLKLIGGISTNTFNYPDTTYLAYQLAATYKPGKNHLFRAVFSHSPRSSNIFDTYVDQTVAFFPTGYQQFFRVGLYGNKNLRLLTADLVELGYRSRLSSRLNMDVEIFDIRSRNSNIVITGAMCQYMLGPNTVTEMPLVSTNLPLQFHQRGATLSFAYSSKEWQVKPFITIQRSRIKNYAPNHNAPDAGMGPGNMYSGMGTVYTHKSTPTVYGGASVNYVPTDKININLNGYYYSKQTYHHLANVLLNDGVRGIDTIKGKLILNTSISYEAVEKLHIFISAKNMLNQTHREFYRSDVVPFRLMGGIMYEF
jgi:iron complex outermembrane recepter protein